MPTDSAVPRSILSVVYHGLETALTRQFARRYDTGLLLRLVDRSEDGRTMSVRVDCRGLMRMSVEFAVTHAAGNMYDVLCTVENEAVRRFSYSRPRRAGPGLSDAPYLGREIATFLVDQFEKRLGRRLLRRPAAPPDGTAAAS
jgi:hypothetical protein